MSQLSFDDSDYGAGGRGGPVPPNTFESAAERYSEFYMDEQQLLRHTILVTCVRKGECHADDLRHLAVTQANGIGIAFGVLKRMRLIEPTVFRMSRWPERRAKSWVYRLTERGRYEAGRLR